MIKQLIKSFLTIIFIFIIIAGIVASIYYFSPTIKPGEYGVVYKVFGKNKGFTGKILPPGKYYYFLSGLIPGVYKVYIIRIKPEFKTLKLKLYDGTEVTFDYGYDIDKKNIDKFLSRVNENELNKIFYIYFKSAFENAFLSFSPYQMIADNFNKILSNKVLTNINNELSFFGLKVIQFNIKKISYPKDKEEIFSKLEQNKVELEKLRVDTQKKIQEEKILNKLKVEKLNFLLKKAEIEKEIIKKKIEASQILWQNQKKRLEEEVNILSKPGGENAAKLEAIRMLVNGLKSEKKVKNASETVEKIFNK